ncbi:gas vesicle protein [Streptomyces glebosus]|uniref:Gas vesicle protein n=1 Tax=Streptomyces glebosus TaxID=249580 RepID=A0A640T5N4_9ACTN|nr:GvpL/GvpF family gas vesicle protein [Streptomyces glebosus]GFE19003.1 gas vesicle protein [Streptomyces glebosus]GHG48517.1 gas vesicle protein [Streptomyces glebosus]
MTSHLQGDDAAAAAPQQPLGLPTEQRESAPPSSSYVYAIGRAGAGLDTAAPRLTGLRDGRVRTASADGLTALVSSVPADAFSEEGMKAQLENLTELEEIARTHHRVVEAAHTRTTVLPMRLATVYLDDARVRSMLRERGAEFDALLSRLEGHAELGVKVYADPRAAAADPAPATSDGPEPAAPPVSPGRAYLRQRRARRQTQRDAYRAAGAVADEVRDRAAALARDRVAHRPQQGELAAGVGENIANEAYLVPMDRLREFHRALTVLADGVPGVRIEVTGPWAPYSFAAATATPPAESRSA